MHLFLEEKVSQRTIKRWINQWILEGKVESFGKNKSAQYALKTDAEISQKNQLLFLKGIPQHKQSAVLAELRDLWTHNSTSIEGNTLTLGETYDILEYGLTISGKPLKEHQEIIGHAKAISMLYDCILSNSPFTKALICKLHKAVQTEKVLDIYKPMGDWKLEVNGCRAMDVQKSKKSVYIEYAHPVHVSVLMDEYIKTLNAINTQSITLNNAPEFYAKWHMGFVHIHPFWDGNGRLARLIANLPILKAGLPPVIIDKNQRKDYIVALSSYQIRHGTLTPKTGVWPSNDYNELIAFCQKSYLSTI
ncbi:Fic domain protein, MA2133 type, partial [hydrothermal vent metagenome]